MTNESPKSSEQSFTVSVREHEIGLDLEYFDKYVTNGFAFYVTLRDYNQNCLQNRMKNVFFLKKETSEKFVYPLKKNLEYVLELGDIF